MSDPKDTEREADELALDAETVKDLDVAEDDEVQVRGGTRSTYLK